MTEVPKIVHQRLRSSGSRSEALAPSHPEADLLTAFAEQALAAPEREGILQHLALCADCRDVIALAAPADAFVPTPAEVESETLSTPILETPGKSRPGWFAWPGLGWQNLRGAALAGGLAVAILVAGPGVEHLFKPNQPASSVATLSSPTAQRPGSVSQVESKSVNGKLTTEKAAEPAEPKAAPAALPSYTVSNKSHLNLVPSPQSTRQKESEQARLDQPTLSNGLKKKSLSGDLALQLGTSAGTTGTFIGGAPRNEAATDNTLMARADAPAIEKAKPPLKDSDTAYEAQKTSAMTAQTESTSLASSGLAPSGMVALRAAAPAVIPASHADWKIDAGVLRRSLDTGKSWQTAVQSNHALLCYSNRGNEVWAGGKAGTLLHSTDSGTTWTAVAPSFEGQSLALDVIHVDVRGLNEVVLVTDNHETWNSPDGGKTWVKK
jgi:hypothetical protein